MKNLKKLSRNDLKKMTGGKLMPSSGGCEAGHGCEYGAIWNDFAGTPHWNCCGK